MRSIAFAVALAWAAAGCGGDDETVPDGPTASIDGAAGQPDGPENRPDGGGGGADAPPGTPDASPGAQDAPANQADASPGTPDAAGGGIDAGPPGIDAGACDEVAGEPTLELHTVVDGLTEPVTIALAPGDDRLYVVEQPGTIQIIDGGATLADPFLDITSLTSGGSEQGLLGLAFHPDYADNGRFFVYYTNNSGNIQIVEYARMDGDADHADPDSARPIIMVPHPTNSNHNGGNILFGPDGYLYAGTGDGGSAGDPPENAQNIEVLLGKMLRLDVNGTDTPYEIPPDNPFVTVDGADEIWAMGLRNPWRFSFDRLTDDLYIGDVGQNCWEEIDAIDPDDVDGVVNFGWDQYEGDAEYECPAAGCSFADKVFPIYTYPHDTVADPCGGQASVTGGFVYRGCRMPGLQGRYYFADYFGIAYSLVWSGGVATDVRREPSLDVSGTSSFGEDRNGELLLASHDEGILYRIAPAP